MIVMYHRFEADKPNSDMNRTPDAFRNDLEQLYSRGYYPVTVSDIVDGRLEVPGGKTPIALTFDDSYESQLRFIPGPDGQAKLDPNCAVGILDSFAQTHPHWKATGTFFILPASGKFPPPFYQPEYVSEKFAYLKSHGYEVGNHTTTHRSLSRMSPDRIREELATPVKYLAEVAPDIKMRVMAAPYGLLPRKIELPLLVSGQYDGVKYHNNAVLTAAWRPVLSPFTKPDKRYTDNGKLAVFNPLHLERVKPDPKREGANGTLEYWLKYFDKNRQARYISGGNPRVAAVPKSLKGRVNLARLKAAGRILQVYALPSSNPYGRYAGM